MARNDDRDNEAIASVHNVHVLQGCVKWNSIWLFGSECGCGKMKALSSGPLLLMLLRGPSWLFWGQLELFKSFLLQ
jgi:hypothetical protein